MDQAATLAHEEAAARKSWWVRLLLQEDLNFLLTNRIPRRQATLLMGWYSHLRSRKLTRLSVAIWSLFADELNLAEAEDQDFESLHDVFVRKLRPGARPVDTDPDVIVSPCDGIVGATGRIQAGTLIQAKGFDYQLSDLLADEDLIERYRNGWYVTIRLKSNMYHRFHAPHDCRVRRVIYHSGDTWNVNPIALKRVEQLFCKNERAVVELELQGSAASVTLVPVAAILVAGIKLHCLGETLDLRYRGKNRFACDAQYSRGDELGYFQSGSTIIVLGSEQLSLHARVQEGRFIKFGQPLLSGARRGQ
jgi:phosphatidylserine decarboxylase